MASHEKCGFVSRCGLVVMAFCRGPGDLTQECVQLSQAADTDRLRQPTVSVAVGDDNCDNSMYSLSLSKVKKAWTLAIAPLTWVRLVTSSALQSRKWQLIGMMVWYSRVKRPTRDIIGHFGDGFTGWLAWASGAAAHYVAIHCPR